MGVMTTLLVFVTALLGIVAWISSGVRRYYLREGSLEYVRTAYRRGPVHEDIGFAVLATLLLIASGAAFYDDVERWACWLGAAAWAFAALGDVLGYREAMRKLEAGDARYDSSPSSRAS